MERVGVFVVGVAAIVLGALILADGVLAYAGVSGMPSYLNVATVIFGDLGWVVNVATGAIVAGLGGILTGMSRWFRA